MWNGDIWEEWGAAEERSWLMCVNLFGCGSTSHAMGMIPQIYSLVLMMSKR